MHFKIIAFCAIAILFGMKTAVAQDLEHCVLSAYSPYEEIAFYTEWNFTEVHLDKKSTEKRGVVQHALFSYNTFIKQMFVNEPGLVFNAEDSVFSIYFVEEAGQELYAWATPSSFKKQLDKDEVQMYSFLLKLRTIDPNPEVNNWTEILILDATLTCTTE